MSIDNLNMAGRKITKEVTEEEKKGMPLYSIGVVSELLGTTDQTLRLYEKHGLLTPARRNKTGSTQKTILNG